ncbi:MAG: Pseudogene of right-handed parallel beta-helix repeat-containing [Methanobrevibacter sp. CfCl-M3]
MNRFNMLVFIGGFCLLGLLLLVSAQVIDDSGDSKIISVNGTVCNFTVTPHRTNNNTGFITLDITADKELSKAFTFKHDQKNYTIDMNDNSSVSYNTTTFNLDDGCNETLTFDEFNLTLNVEFKNQNPSPLPYNGSLNRILNNYSLGSTIHVINSTNNSIQAAIDNANPGDTIELDGGTYYQHEIYVNKENLTLKASGNGGIPVIDGEGQGRAFNATGYGVTIQDLSIKNTKIINGSGGGIFMSDGGSVMGCNFTNITSNGTNITSNGGGGGIYITGGSVTGCNFTNTTADHGGGIYITGGSVTGCNFTNITSNGGGGGIYIRGGNVTGCNFTNITSNGGGGGIYIIGGSVTGCNFTNITSNGTNITSNGGGGGIYIIGGSVTGCNFTNTTANRDGGGVYSVIGSVSGCSFTNTTANRDGGGIFIIGGNVTGCNFTNITSNGGGGIYIVDGNVTGCNFTNTTANRDGGGVYSVISSVSGCSFTNTSAIFGGGVFVSSGGCSVVFNRFVNNTDNGSMVGNGVTCFGSCNVSSNWWGNNTPQNITNGVMEDYYQVELSANQVSTRDVNKSVNGIVPVSLGYRMCLSGSNNTSDVGRLPDFNATIELNNNSFLFRFSHSMSPGDVNITSAKNQWNNTINNTGSYVLSGLVDNQILNINISAIDLPNPPGPPGSNDNGTNSTNGTGGDGGSNGDDDNGGWFNNLDDWDGLLGTGFPLIVMLIVLSVFGLIYYRRR